MGKRSKEIEEPELPEDRIGKGHQKPVPKSKHRFRENLGFWENFLYNFGIKSLEELGYDGG